MQYTRIIILYYTFTVGCTGEILLRAGKMERTSSFDEIRRTKDAGESGSMEC